MNTYIALLRGINVVGNNQLPMKELVSILEKLGYENVQTYIQSGNVVFGSKKKMGDKDAGKIGKAILNKKGFEPKILILSPSQLSDAVKNNPYPTDIGTALHLFFLESQPPKPNLEKLEQIKIDSERFKLTKEVFYLYAPEGVGRSKLASSVEKLIGVPATARNWNTVCKIASMVEGS